MLLQLPLLQLMALPRQRLQRPCLTRLRNPMKMPVTSSPMCPMTMKVRVEAAMPAVRMRMMRIVLLAASRIRRALMREA